MRGKGNGRHRDDMLISKEVVCLPEAYGKVFFTYSKSNVIMATSDELKQLIEGTKKDLCDKIDSLVKKLEEKENKVVELHGNVRLLSEKVAFNEKRFELFERHLDDNEQYSRRTSLRLNGIPYSGNESSEQSLKKVKDEVFNLGLQNDFVDRDFDRAHRVGYSHDRDGKLRTDRQMIVKFTSFWARSKVYRARPKVIYIDQTKRRFNLRKMAVDYVKDKPEVDFVFADINCSLCVRLKNGQFKFFCSKEELLSIVG